MPIYKPTELLNFLEQLGIAPKKGLSQNFLIDGNILNKIAVTANVTPGEYILEIGPGPGSLTEELLKKGGRVLAVEKDQVLASALNRLNTPDNRLEVFCDDIMTFPLEEVLRQKVPAGNKIKVIANLPYHLTTPIIARLITMNDLFSSLIFMVQDEVARRFTASHNTSAYSSFTVFLNFYSNPRYAFTVSNNCFYPSPKVHSAIVVLDLKQPPKVSDETAFFVMTRSAFEHRRKMLRGSLRELYDPEKIQQCLTEIGQNPLARPENLTLNEFIQLFEKLRAN